MTRAAGSESLESEFYPGQTRSANWGQLALDIHVAAKTKVPVLISAPPECAVSIARAIAAFAGAWKANDVVVWDCAGDNLKAALAGVQSLNGRHPNEAILLLREVHALDAAEQAAVAGLLTAWYTGEGAPRIISTSSVSLFDRVREGTFDEQLFYSLNALHIVVRAGSWTSTTRLENDPAPPAASAPSEKLHDALGPRFGHIDRAVAADGKVVDGVEERIARRAESDGAPLRQSRSSFNTPV